MAYVDMNQYTKIIKKRIILEDINLKIAEGEVVGLLGRNASGKTMILRAISGLILPEKGTIRVAYKQLAPNHRFPDSCGLIIENMGFWPSMTAKATLEVLCSIKHTASKDDIQTALVRVGLDPDDKRTVKKFSLGMKQKLAIAQAIVEKPDLILLDEPTNSLDKESREMFYQIVRDERARGATIVMSSHIEEDLSRVCDRTIGIEEGKVIS